MSSQGEATFQESDMNPIVHLSLKVDDVQKTGEFYRQVFGFRDAETRKTRDHLSRHMTDGALDFTLMEYDAGTQSAESKAAGEGPCIHHFALEVPEVAKATELIKAAGGEKISDPGVLPVKFRAVGGTVAELVPVGRYRKPAIEGKIGRVIHIALRVDDVEKTAAFYKSVFGFQDEPADARERNSRHMTDGRIDFALLQYDTGAGSKAAGAGPCIHHFAVEVDDVERATEQIKAFGCEITSEPGVLPVKFRAPGGTLAELVPTGRYGRV
jgi:lactoylglutathione lyase